MNEQFNLDGKTAIVTGGTRGIGLAIARGFLEAGANVTICSRKQQNVDAALEELGTHADRVHGVVAHVGQEADIRTLVETSESQFGELGVLVNNAGTNPYYGPIIDSEAAAWDKTMDVNLKGPYLLSQACARQMVQTGGGSIINIASIAGLTASENQGIYSVSKAALIMLTKVMARELGKRRVRVNCICPGLIKTKLSQAMWADEKTEAHFANMKALGRIGNTAELTGAAIYLASEASSFTTGSILQVDGGMVL